MQLDLIKRDKELLNKFTQQHIEKVKQTNQIIEMQNRSNQSLAAAIIGTQI